MFEGHNYHKKSSVCTSTENQILPKPDLQEFNLSKIPVHFLFARKWGLSNTKTTQVIIAKVLIYTHQNQPITDKSP